MISAAAQSAALRIPITAPSALSVVTSVIESSRAARKQVWLALHFNDWPLYAALHSLTAQQRAQWLDQPVAVLADDRQRRVLTCNQTASALGISAGHTLNAALSLCNELKLLPRNVRAETRLLDDMAHWALRYTPLVSVLSPNELLLEVRGSLRLFGGLQAFMQHVQQALQARQLNVGLALTATARASLWLARARQASRDNNASLIVPPKQLKTALSALPLSCLHWPMELQLRLLDFGLHRLGELWRLPRADLARRIGVKYLQQLDAALGRQIEVQSPFKPMPLYSQRLMLEFEVHTTALLETALQNGLQNLQRYLLEHELALSRVHIELCHRDQRVTPLRIGLATPTSDMQRVAVLLHERLSALALSAPILEINLRVKRLLPAQAVARDLFAGSSAAGMRSTREKLGRLSERLQARLGSTAVRSLRLQSDHRPEVAQANEAVELNDHVITHAVPELPLRPLWLLPQPVSLCEGNRPPVELRILQGPERIEAGWWNDAPIRRDYYLARHRNQSWCWVFKQWLPTPAWYLHGWFA